jgi:hypothetical protein
MAEQEPPKARPVAWRAALRLLSLAGRREVKQLDKLSKGGTIIDQEQRAVLAWIADQLSLMALGEGEEGAQELLGLVNRQAEGKGPRR